MSSSMAVEQKGEALSRDSSSSVDAPSRLDPWNPSDFAGPENHVPLSPQWLFPKPHGDSKPSQATGELSHSFGASSPLTSGLDPPIKRDQPSSMEKKKDRWEIGRKDRWSEEERDSTFVGSRHDRWKEEEREGKDLRRGDRWVDPLFKEPGESRRLPQSEPRDTSFDMRRDVKWSNKWGPDGDGKTASPISTKQDNAQDITSRERDNIWRPHSLSTRGRGESPSFAGAPQKHAPGFGTGRARNESSNMGFIAGRGRGSSSSNNFRNGHLSPAATGGSLLLEKQDSSGQVLRYSRAKLLDIYRQNSASPSFARFPEELAEIHQLTTAGAAKPLALSAPNKEEEAVLEGIEKGDIITGGATPSASKDLHTSRSLDVYGRGKGPNDHGMETVDADDADPENNNEDGPLRNKVAFESNHGTDAGSTGVWRPNRILDSDELSRRRDSRSDGLWRRTKSGDLKLESGQKFDKIFSRDNQLHSPLERAVSFKDEKGWNAGKGTDESDLLFKRFNHGEGLYNSERLAHLSHADSISARVGGASVSNSTDHDKKDSIRSNPLTSPEDLSLVYMDPQGEVQGPFLGVDIIGWFEAGYFGIDLPVRLANAPNGTAFMALGNMMPHLKPKPRVPPGFNAVKQIEDTSDRQNLQNRLSVSSSTTVSNFVQEPIEHGSKNDAGGHSLFQNRLSGHPPTDSQFFESLQPPTRPWPSREPSEMTTTIPGLGNISAFEPNVDPYHFPSETFPGLSHTPSKVSDRVEDINSSTNRNLPHALLDSFQAHLVEQHSRQQVLHHVGQEPYQSPMAQHQVGLTHATHTQDANLNPMHGTAGLGQMRYTGLTPSVGLNVLQQLSGIQALPQPSPAYGPLSPSGPVLDQFLRLQQQQQQQHQQHQQQLPRPALVDQWLRQQQTQPLTHAGPSQSALGDQLLPRQAGDAAKLEIQSQHQHHFFQNPSLEFQTLSHAGISRSNHVDRFPHRQVQEGVKFDSQAQQHSHTGTSFVEQHLSEDLALKLLRQKQRDEHAQTWPNGKDLEEAVQTQLSATNFPNHEPINLIERLQTSGAVHLHPQKPPSVIHKLDRDLPLEELEHERPDLPDVITRILLPLEKSPASGRDGASTRLQSEEHAFDHGKQESISRYESSFPFSYESQTIASQESHEESALYIPSTLGLSFAESRLPEGTSSLDSIRNPVFNSYQRDSFFLGQASSNLEDMETMNEVIAQEEKPLDFPVSMGKSAATPPLLSGERWESFLPSVEPSELAWNVKQFSKPKSLLEIQEEEKLEVERHEEAIHVMAPSGDAVSSGAWVTSSNMTISKSFKQIQEEEALRNATKTADSSGLWDTKLPNKEKTDDSKNTSKVTETGSSKTINLMDSLPASSSDKNIDDIKLGYHGGKLAVSASLSSGVDDTDFLEPKESKKSKRRNKAKSAGSKATPVSIPDPVSVPLATVKSSSSGKMQESIKEMLLAPPPGPSLGDYFPTKEDMQSPQPSPAWSADLWKQQSTALSLKEIQEAEKKGKQEQKKLLQTTSQPQSEAQTIPKVSGTVNIGAKSASSNHSSAKTGWPQPSVSPPTKTAIITSNSKSKKIMSEDDDDLFWDYPDALKSGSNQKKSSKADSKLDTMGSLPKVSKSLAKWDYTELDDEVGLPLSANTSTSDFPAFPEISAAGKRSSAPVKGKKNKAGKLTEAAPSVAVVDSKISDCKMFHEWCAVQIKKLTGNSDMSLLDFCIALPTSKEAGEYLSTYLGKGAEIQAFEEEFMRQKDLLPRDILCQLFSPSEAVVEGDVRLGMTSADKKAEKAVSNQPESYDSISKASKKKGKKGKKVVDPSLLGFSVTSSRILMGEIQHVED